MPVLRITDGPGKGLVVPLEIGSKAVTLGRDAANQLPLADAKASRVHAEVVNEHGRWLVRDLGSSNGTWNDAGRIETMPLGDGTTFRIGSTYLRFESRLANTKDKAVGGDAGPGRLTALDHENSTLFTKTRTSSVPSEELLRINGYLAVLHQIVLRAGNLRSRDALFELLDETAAEALEGDRCAVFLPAPEVNELGGWVLWPTHERRLRARFGAVPFARTLLTAVRQGGESLLCTISGDIDPTASMAEAGVTSAMAAPSRVGGEVHALLYVDRIGGEAPFTRTDLEFLAAVANQIAVQLANREKVAGLEAEVQRLAAAPRKHGVELVTADASMQPVLAFVAKAAPTLAPVLILGESGTGKELVARAIREQSLRADKPLQVVNCAALAESLVEATLFGHVKGAFTGADETRPGVFELADQATLFLDEIGELPLAIQAKLLRALEQGEVQRLGDSAVRKVDVRLIAATNRDLAEEVRKGRFREDLYHRLAVLCVTIPPLRERPADIDALADHFLRFNAERLGQPLKRLAPEARAALLRHPWPGNVRQLRNAIERACILSADKVILASDLPQPAGAPAERPAQGGDSGGFEIGTITTLAEVERTHILRVLDHCGGNKKAAAEILAIDRSTLYAKLRQYGRL